MSHFYVMAIVPSTETDIEKYIDERMERYNEQREVDPYQRKCYCVGYEARMAAIEAANAATGGMDKIRDAHWAELRAKFDLPKTKFYYDMTEDQQEQADAMWAERLKPFEEAEAAAYVSHPMADKPDPKCESVEEDGCGGTGLRTTTYNPDSKWDWYRVGGRWDGVIQESPRDDGKTGGNYGDEHQQLRNNTVTVKELLAKEDDDWVPFAILLPDGTWLEKGKMGWFACVTDEKKKDDWRSQVRQALFQFGDHIAVALDCHI